MTEKMMVYLNTAELTKSMWTIGEKTRIGEIPALMQAAKNREVIVMVNAEDVLLVMAKLPKMNRARMLQALPYALEEQLINDVEELHFAAADLQDNGELPVAVIAKNKMQDLMDILEQWHLKPEMLTSVVFALPWQDKTWRVAITKDIAIVRSGRYQGFCCEVSNLTTLLHAAIEEQEIKPETVCIDNYTDTEMPMYLTVSVKETFAKPESTFLEAVQKQQKIDGINLLQGAFSVRGKKRKEWQFGWKVVAILATVVVGVLFLNPIVANVILSSRLNEINQQIAVIYKRQFPESKNMVAAKERLTQKWQQLSNAGNESEVLRELGIIGQALKQAPSVRIKRFDFQGAEATLELGAPTSEEYTKFTDYLINQGLTVKQQNANLSEGRISASIQISAS